MILVGWSMGAYLAMDAALAWPEHIQALYLLSIRRQWPADEIEEIRNELALDAQVFLRSFYRKCFLGDKKGYRLFQEFLEEHYLTAPYLAGLQDGLTYLAGYPLAQRINQLRAFNIPTIMIHGERDLIAPVEERPTIPGAREVILPMIGHPIFRSTDCRVDLHLRKEAIRRKFSRAAATYEDHAAIQKETALQLAALLPDAPVRSILETGCGTGNYTRLLRGRYPEAHLTALDFAQEMVTQARKNSSPTIDFLCEDAEAFIARTGPTYDLITANATLQWFDDLPGFCCRALTRLNPNGTLLCSIFGPGTMTELTMGLKAVLGHKIRLPAQDFPSRESLERIFTACPGKVAIKEWQIIREYPTIKDLLDQIRKTGTSGQSSGRFHFTRSQLTDLNHWFIENHGGCRIRSQVFLMHVTLTPEAIP